MTCLQLAELVTDYLEGKLSFADRLLFQLHLGLCGLCRIHLEQIRATIETSGRLADLDRDVPAPARDELLARFRGWKNRG